jgi:DNA-binding SARP family transcriptional activator
MHSSMNIYAARNVRMPYAKAGNGRGLFEVHLLAGFDLTHGPRRIVLPWGSQRLLVFLALAGRRLRRAEAAGTLWPDMPEPRAHANLRAALARLTSRAPVLHADALEIGLQEGIEADFREAQAVADRLLAPAATVTADDAARAVHALAQELLPGWYEDWAVSEAEKWRQLRLHALEAAASLLTAAERWGEAVRAAELAIHGDPLRESARAVMIRVHLAEGNQSEALREFERYRHVLHTELRLEPTAALAALLPSPAYA